MSNANQQVDLHLIAEIRRGNEEAKEALILKYMQMVRHIVRKHNMNVMDFDDLVQEGLIGVHSEQSLERSQAVRQQQAPGSQPCRLVARVREQRRNPNTPRLYRLGRHVERSGTVH